MNYFEIVKRLSTLKKFKKLYAEYISFTNRFENPAALIVLNKMRPLAPMTIDSLREVRIGTLITTDAPARGGKKYKINMIKAIFRESLIRHFNLNDQEPLCAIEAAIVKFETLKSRAFIQLFNPFFWIIEFVAYAAEIPFLILERAGIDILEFRKTAAAKFFKICIMVCLLIVLAETTGVLDWVITKLAS
ncbi:MAG: hypothetical protein R3F48_06635 [Candidatus Zixiibacteriota bacterium]